MDNIKLAFLGDIMPGGLLHYKKSSCVNNEVLEYLNGFDLRIGTLECAIGDDLAFYRGLLDENAKNKNIIYANELDIKRLKELRIDIVTIANNHIFDLGVAGLENTIKVLEENNIKYFGAGMNIAEASKPVIVELKGKRIAFLGCTEILPGSPYPADISTPGFNPLIIDKILQDITNLKRENDYVFVLPHWDIEYNIIPLKKNRDLAFRMISAGADGVFGGHSHVAQPPVFYKKKPIVFSMGNFLFPDRYVQPPAPTYYPAHNLDINKIPHSTSPFCKEITLKKWIARANIGMIAGLQIYEQKKLIIKFTKYTNQQLIQFHKKSIFKQLFFNVGSFMIRWCYALLSSLIWGLKFIRRTQLAILKRK